MNNQDQLLPCPCCGGTELDYAHDAGDPKASDYIMCNGEHGCGLMISAIDAPGRDMASVWNRRAQQTASAEPASPWIAVTDRLPDEHRAVYLCLYEDGHQQIDEWLHVHPEGWCFWYGDPTHWMPLPDAPAKGGDGEAA